MYSRIRVLILSEPHQVSVLALTDTMTRSLVSASEVLSTDVRVRAIVFTGMDLAQAPDSASASLADPASLLRLGSSGSASAAHAGASDSTKETEVEIAVARR